MPKTAKYALNWSAEYTCYQFTTKGEATIVPVSINDEQWWYTWLEEHTSFAFNGRNGHLTLLKEARKQRGKSYWYAYQRQGVYTKKRYAGRSSELSIVHLEDIAAHFQSISQWGDAPTQSPIPTIVPPPPEAASPLLLPKIQPPHLASSLVTRVDLLARLDTGMSAKLTMVVAPAGFGKTTLVRQWIATHSTDMPVAWITLDSHDNEPQRFWRYICAACQTFGISTDFLAVNLSHGMALFPFAAPSLIESVLTPLLNNLTQMKGHGILVLDDYQVIQKPQIQQTLMFLLDYLPSTLHILLLSRSIPSLPLARLRGRGEVHDIGTGDLRFSVAETTDFLRSTSKFLTPKIIERITMRLEGWPTGLRMFALNLPRYQSLEEIERHLNTVSGSDHYWQDYFVREVLETQPEHIQHFLLQTSILDRLTGSLCCALTDDIESTRVLETLFQKNLFLEKIEGEGGWYRYHQLFAEAMRHEASRRLGPDAQRELFQRASTWYEQHALLPEAIEAAFNSGQLPRVAQLLSHLTKVSTTATAQFDPLKLAQAEYWLSQIPYELFDEYPDLYITYVTALAFSHGPDNMTPETLILTDQLLNKAEHIWRIEENYPALGIAFAFHSMISYRQGNLTRAGEYAQQALNWLSDIWRPQKAICWTIIGICAFQARQFELSRQAHQTSCHLWDTQKQQHGVRGNTILMALACLEMGEMQQAAAYLQWTLDEADRYDDRYDAALSRLGLAHIYYSWNELDRARQMALAITTVLTEQENPEIHIRAELILAKIQCAQCQFSAARQHMSALLARPSSRSSSLLYQEIIFLQVRLLYFMNDLYAAQRSLRLLALVEQPPHLTAGGTAADTNSSNLIVYEAAGTNPDIDEQRTLLDARLLLAQDNAREACERLMGFFAMARAGRLNRAILEAQALFVLALTTEHRLQEATKTLHMLLSQTMTENYLRLFLDEGEPMAQALCTLLPSIHEKAQRAYLLTILRAFPDSQTASVIKQGRFGGLRIGRTLIDSEEQPITVGHNHPGGLLGQDASPSFFCFCPQDELEPILLKAAYERGGDLRFSTAMTSFEQDEDGVTATIVERPSGDSRTIRAQYMVAADGARSPIRTVLGITTSGQGTIEHYLNIYFHADLSELVRDRTFSQCSIENTDVRGLFISINNTDRWSFHLKYDPTRGERAEDFPAERCLALLRKAIGIADITIEIKSIGPWEAAVQIADRYQVGRVHLIGDAAHLMPPWGGHGANTGIADAHNLAWKLAAVLKGQASPALLATCIEERRPIAKMAAEQAALGTDIYTRYGIATNDNAELLQQRINPFLLILGYHYHSRSILEKAGNTAFGEDTLSGQPGTRVPHIWFEREGQKFSTIDLLGKHFVLFTTVGEEGNAWCEAAQTAAKQLALGLDIYRIGPNGDLPDPDGRWLAAIHGQSDDVLLVRPDGFVAWRTHGGEVVSAAVCERIFKHILGFEFIKV